MEKDTEKRNKKCKNTNLILLKSILEGNDKKCELTEEENDLKKRLVDIENKLESVDKVVSAVSQERPDTIFASEAFEMLVESIAITAAIGAVAEYLDISMDEIDDLLK